MRNRIFILSMCAWIVGLVACSAIMNDGESRPFREVGPHFSHPQHVELGLDDCSVCHEPGENGVPGMPARDFCMECHADIDPEKPEDHQAGSFFDADGNGQWSNAVKLDPERIFDHAKHVESNESCTDCHAAVVTGAMIPVGSRLTMQECMSCHEQKAPDYNDCSTCHKELREDTRPKSHLAGWDRAHGRAAIAGDFDDLPRDCALCHQQKSFCDDCHRAEMPRDHTNAFRMHGHAARASIDRDRCETCHTTDSCSECHKDAMPRSHRAVWGEPFNRHCNGCHLPVQSFGEVGCAVCHEDTPSHATAPMRPGNPIHQTNDPNQCRECHTPMEHPDNGQSCLLCHQ